MGATALAISSLVSGKKFSLAPYPSKTFCSDRHGRSPSPDHGRKYRTPDLFHGGPARSPTALESGLPGAVAVMPPPARRILRHAAHKKRRRRASFFVRTKARVGEDGGLGEGPPFRAGGRAPSPKKHNPQSLNAGPAASDGAWSDGRRPRPGHPRCPGPSLRRAR